MLVHIVRDYYLSFGKKSISALLLAGKDKKTGEDLFQTLGYCGTIERALIVCKERELERRVNKQKRIMEFKELIDMQRDVNNEFVDAMNGILRSGKSELQFDEKATFLDVGEGETEPEAKTEEEEA